MQLPIQHGVSLSERTTLSVGGPARFWLQAHDVDTVRQALEWSRQRNIPVEVLGGGSNTLVADRGVQGLVLRVCIDHLRVRAEPGSVLVEAGAGLEWDALVRWAVAEGYAGLECLSGIPGDLGAAPIQNIGAYGQEVSQAIERVHVVERSTGQVRSMDRGACDFGYRDSAFKREADGRYIIVGVDLRLAPGQNPAVAHPELERALARFGTVPTLAATRETVLALRRAKSMVLDPDDENRRSAGSFFVNPTLGAQQAEQVIGRARDTVGPTEPIPRHALSDGRTKLAAAWLIERAGLPKGTRQGRVGLSTRHALAIVNAGGATAREIVAFAAMVRARVFEHFGVELRPEPRLVGFAPAEVASLVEPLGT